MDDDDGLVAQSCLTLVTPWTVAHQAPLSLGFSRHEYWSRLPFPTPGDLPNPGIKPASLVSTALACVFFTTSAQLTLGQGTAKWKHSRNET